MGSLDLRGTHLIPIKETAFSRCHGSPGTHAVYIPLASRIPLQLASFLLRHKVLACLRLTLGSDDTWSLDEPLYIPRARRCAGMPSRVLSADPVLSTRVRTASCFGHLSCLATCLGKPLATGPHPLTRQCNELYIIAIVAFPC